MKKDGKVLILSCGTGGGHNSAALAVQENLQDKGIKADFIEYLDIINEKIKNGVNKLYISSTRLNGRLFKRVYRLGELYSKTNFISPVYGLNRLNKKRLYRYITENGYDFIVTTHLFAAQALTAIKKDYPIRFVAIATDYVCIPFWEETNPDFFIIPNEDLSQSFVEKGIPKEKLLPYGIPVSKVYRQEKSKEEACRSLCLENKDKYILILTGSMGFGNITNALREFLDKIPDVIFIIACGNNKKMLSTINEEFKENKRVMALGYTNKISDYMAASEIVLTKPGGLTTTEISNMGRPFILTMPIPGCETYNAEYFEKRKMAIKCDILEEVIDNTKKLYENKELQKELVKNQKKNIKRNTCDKIAEIILKI